MVEFRENGKNSEHDVSEQDWEQELRKALAPIAPPVGFADRVLARIEPQPMRREQPLPFHGSIIRSSNVQGSMIHSTKVRGAVAALLLLALTFGYVQHERARNLAGQRARQQVLLALRITSSTLQAVQSKVDSNRMN